MSLHIRVLGVLCLAMCHVFFSPSGLADVITMKNGMTLQGTVTAESPNGFTLDVDGTVFTVAKKEVMTVERGGKTYAVEEGVGQVIPGLARDKNDDSESASAPPSGVEGAIDEEVVAPAKGPVLPLLPAASPSGKTIRVMRNAVRLRSGPGTSFDIVSFVHQGTILGVVDREDDWLKCQLPDGAPAWILADYTETVPETLMLVNGRRVNVREGPSGNMRSLERLNKGVIVAALSPGEEWVRVRTPSGRIGWIHGRLLQQPQSPDVLRPRLRACEWKTPRPEARVVTSAEGTVLQVTTAENTLVLGEAAGFVVLLPTASGLPLPGPSAQGNILWYTLAKDSAMLRDLGLGTEETAGAQAAAVYHVKGQWLEKGTWSFLVPIGGVGRGTVGIVVQEGPERGCLLTLQTIPK